MENRKFHSYILSGLVLFAVWQVRGQTDSVSLPEVTIASYLGKKSLLRLPSSTALVDSAKLNEQHGQSLVPVLNTIPGVRMEERSPGSYRLSIRGSLIRSPFGVRNIKIYLDEMPLTNASGETYLNLIDQHSIQSIEVLKGPDGSLFGANSGGVMRLSPFAPDTSSYAKFCVGGGSYGLGQENINVRQKIHKHLIKVDQGWQRSEGYRVHSAMDRKFLQLSDQFLYKHDGELKVLFFYADHQYQTPGGLTFAQIIENPRQSRPGTAFSPGAKEQNSSIRNRTFFGGIVNHVAISKRFTYLLSIFGAQTFFENPFITNYEVRDERNLGARTWLKFHTDNESPVKLNLNLGAEVQEMGSYISNYTNTLGMKGNTLAEDEISTSQGFIFFSGQIDFYNKFLFDFSASYNQNKLWFQRQVPPSEARARAYKEQLMPRVALSYLLFKQLSFRAIVSRGYSPPTLQEIRPSGLIVNTTLQPESGWNYEAGLRLQTKNQRLKWDLAAYYYKLENAITRMADPNGTESFRNAKGTEQQGLESVLELQIKKYRDSGFLRALSFSQSSTFSFYELQNEDPWFFPMAGVPEQFLVSSLKMSLPAGIYLFLQHTYCSEFPLNDFNTEFSGAYNLGLFKMGWRKSFSKFQLDLNGGIDNITGDLYSLGHDLNAFGGRYYNPAPPRNYFIRLGLSF